MQKKFQVCHERDSGSQYSTVTTFVLRYSWRASAPADISSDVIDSIYVKKELFIQSHVISCYEWRCTLCQ